MKLSTFKTLSSTCLALSYTMTSLVSAEAKKPNIIYIIADDLGYNDLSCYGQKFFKTPHLDKMAAEAFALPITIQEILSALLREVA